MKTKCLRWFHYFESCLPLPSYAPGITDEVFDDNSCSVTFYDGTQSIIERDDVYLIDQDIYDRDVDYIRKCEEDMVGQAVIARENNSGEYKLGRFCWLS